MAELVEATYNKIDSMNSFQKIVFFLIAFVPFDLYAQTSVDLDSEFGGRITVRVD